MREANEKIFNNQVVRNKYIWMALATCFAALFAAYFIPVLQTNLAFVMLELKEWGLVIISSLSTLLIIQIIKSVFKI